LPEFEIGDTDHLYVRDKGNKICSAEHSVSAFILRPIYYALKKCSDNSIAYTSIENVINTEVTDVNGNHYIYTGDTTSTAQNTIAITLTGLLGCNISVSSVGVSSPVGVTAPVGGGCCVLNSFTDNGGGSYTAIKNNCFTAGDTCTLQISTTSDFSNIVSSNAQNCSVTTYNGGGLSQGTYYARIHVVSSTGGTCDSNVISTSFAGSVGVSSPVGGVTPPCSEFKAYRSVGSSAEYSYYDCTGVLKTGAFLSNGETTGCLSGDPNSFLAENGEWNIIACNAVCNSYEYSFNGTASDSWLMSWTNCATGATESMTGTGNASGTICSISFPNGSDMNINLIGVC
jgi:hypothetical protein